MNPECLNEKKVAAAVIDSLARQMNLPLFFQGTDFANTDLANAMKTLGYEMSTMGVPQQPATPQR